MYFAHKDFKVINSVKAQLMLLGGKPLLYIHVIHNIVIFRM